MVSAINELLKSTVGTSQVSFQVYTVAAVTGGTAQTFDFPFKDTSSYWCFVTPSESGTTNQAYVTKTSKNAMTVYSIGADKSVDVLVIGKSF